MISKKQLALVLLLAAAAAALLVFENRENFSASKRWLAADSAGKRAVAVGKGSVRMPAGFPAQIFPDAAADIYGVLLYPNEGGIGNKTIVTMESDLALPQAIASYESYFRASGWEVSATGSGIESGSHSFSAVKPDAAAEVVMRWDGQEEVLKTVITAYQKP